jgi:sterol desaturase/sphingolipid hydroxylase (fatty acid hydroxylase superfamily)
MSTRGRWQWILFGAVVGTLYVVERLRPLRARKEPGLGRTARNLTIGLIAGATTAASEWPLVEPAQRLAERNQLGLLPRLPLPRVVRLAIGFLLLDYTLYLWHRMNHRLPWLWRFHAVHHVDLDLDSTTGVRFHFGELTLAAGFRAAQTLLLGVDRATFNAWQRLLVMSVVFHHSNLELPIEIERRLVRWLVTPRMHGIHHSMRGEETDTNYSSLLSCWDRLHHSLKLNVAQASITIGVAGFSRPEDVTLGKSLTMPFRDDDRLLPPPSRHSSRAGAQVTGGTG